jgi:hypothetical protein
MSGSALSMLPSQSSSTPLQVSARTGKTGHLYSQPLAPDLSMSA